MQRILHMLLLTQHETSPLVDPHPTENVILLDLLCCAFVAGWGGKGGPDGRIELGEAE
jgi:hypothetical protein